MNCITDFLPDDTSSHNIDGESIEEIVFGVQPAQTLTPSELDAAIYGTPEYWEAMSNASVEAHAVTLARVKALEEMNTDLKARFTRCFDALLALEGIASEALNCGSDPTTALQEIRSKASEALK